MTENDQSAAPRRQRLACYWHKARGLDWCDCPEVEPMAEQADAVKFIRRLIGECGDGTDDHAWRTCERCLAIHEVQTHGRMAIRLLKVALLALEAK